jgi:hypothetical protein
VAGAPESDAGVIPTVAADGPGRHRDHKKEKEKETTEMPVRTPDRPMRKTMRKELRRPLRATPTYPSARR